MSADDGDLAALLGSRICHDLISPVGAIANGVELLSMSGMSSAPELALISESVENANARIRFFRIAFGAAADGATLGPTEIAETLAAVSKGGRLRIDWSPDGDVTRREGKVAFLLILCLETAMPFGGQIDVSRRGGTWRIAGQASRMKVDPDLWARLSGPSPDADGLASSDVHFALAPRAAAVCGRDLAPEIEEDRVAVAF